MDMNKFQFFIVCKRLIQSRNSLINILQEKKNEKMLVALKKDTTFAIPNGKQVRQLSRQSNGLKIHVSPVRSRPIPLLRKAQFHNEIELFCFKRHISAPISMGSMDQFQNLWSENDFLLAKHIVELVCTGRILCFSHP